MKIKIKLILIYSIIICTTSHAQSNKQTKNAITKMLSHYTGKQKRAVAFIINIYDFEKDQTPELLTKTRLWVNGKEMYTQYDKLEYYQNEKAALWLNHKEKLFRLIPAEKKEENTPTPGNAISNQLEMLMTVCDTIIYNSQTGGKKKYTLFFSHGEYEKVMLYLQDDYAIDKTVYYFRDKTYGYKSETLVRNLTSQELIEIKNKISLIRKAIRNNTIPKLFEDYDSLKE